MSSRIPRPGVTGFTRVYIAGPMTGIEQFNFPAFDAASEDLRDFGYDVVSPAELDSPAARAAALASKDGDVAHYAEGDSWGTLLARDVKLIADEGIEAIVVLPGWEVSRGASLETFVARLCDVPIVAYPDLRPVGATVIDEVHGIEYGGKHPFTGEVETIDSETGGRKGQKPEQFNLLPWEQLADVARLYAAGAAKYAAHNWRKGYVWSLSFDSLIRHAMAFWGGEELDPETKQKHLASVCFHAFALMYFAEHHQEKDDRPILHKAAA